MSRRRVRAKRSDRARFRGGKSRYLGASYNVFGASSGPNDTVVDCLELTDEEASAWPLYSRAHALLPPPCSIAFDPAEYAEFAPAAAQVLQTANGATHPDDVLCALAVLGHTPANASIAALCDFAARDPESDFALVARLAIAECTAIGRAFGIFTAAS